jgi:1-acyl-sn-glycerol-3-phosphate acyltransferase
VGRRSAELAKSLIDEGWSLLIYPEGGRSKDGWGQPFRGGAAFLAKRCGVPVVPVHIEGTGKILPKGGGLPKRSRTTVTFGRPIVPGPDEDSRDLAARIEAAVAALADEAATDWWQARQRAAKASSPSLTGPATGAWRRAWTLGEKDRARSRRRWPDLG